MNKKQLLISGVTDEQNRWLRSEAKKKGLTMSALIKMWINQQVAKGDSNDK